MGGERGQGWLGGPCEVAHGRVPGLYDAGYGSGAGAPQLEVEIVDALSASAHDLYASEVGFGRAGPSPLVLVPRTTVEAQAKPVRQVASMTASQFEIEELAVAAAPHVARAHGKSSDGQARRAAHLFAFTVRIALLAVAAGEPRLRPLLNTQYGGARSSPHQSGVGKSVKVKGAGSRARSCRTAHTAARPTDS